jgi:formate hydrogenlyase transcriptional activator
MSTQEPITAPMPTSLDEVSACGIASYATQGAHIAYFWENEKDFFAGVEFLAAGLRKDDDCVVFGHTDANAKVCARLKEIGFDVSGLIDRKRIHVLGAKPTGAATLGAIGEVFQDVIAKGAPLIRLLGNIGWGKPDWPDDADILAFEARVTEAAKQFPCVVVCMYDLPSLPGHIVQHGGFETHPQLQVGSGPLTANPYYVPAQAFLERIETIAAEIAERKRRDDALERSERRFRSLFENSSDAILLSSPEGKIEAANPAACRLFDRTEEEICRLGRDALVDARDPRLPAFLEERKRLGRVQRELDLVRADGSLFPAEVSSAFYQDLAGVTKAAVIIRDITERRRAQKDADRRNAEMRALIDINRAISPQLERDQLFGALALCLRSVVPAERFGIELPIAGDKLQGHILSAVAAGQATQPAILPAAGTACDWVLQNRDWYIAACREDFRERFPVTYDVMTAQGMESLCAIALVSGSQNRGALFFMSATQGAYRDLRREFMEQVANQIASAIENVDTYEKIAALNATIAATAQRRQTLLEINNAIVSKLTRDDLLAAVCDALAKAIWFDRLALSLYDGASAALRIVAVAGPYRRADYTPIGRILRLEDSPVGQAFQRRQPVIRRDLESERLTASEERAYGHGFRSLCALPLVVRGKSIGAITVGSLTRFQYSDADADFLMEMANQVAMAVENMQLHEETAAMKARFEAEAVYLQEEIKTEHNFEEIIGQSAPVRELLRKLEQVAPTESTVLICGETGTGKELLARAVHDRSKRKERALVKVNCGSIPSGLVESELFGHEKGAFTGALQQRIGRFELAHGGTIFLDEVTELPLDTQVKLLRVLQEGEFERVGSSKTMKVDVRVIAATNRDLEEVVRKGTFRADLYYRLNVFPLESPPLRERRADIPLLVNFFLSRFGKKLGKEVRGVSQKSMDSLARYNWPGNIRELQNVIERAVVTATGPVVQVDDSLLRSGAGAAESAAIETLENNERGHILRALSQTNWVIHGKKGAAELLGINPSTLRSRMEKLGIKKPA